MVGNSREAQELGCWSVRTTMPSSSTTGRPVMRFSTSFSRASSLWQRVAAGFAGRSTLGAFTCACTAKMMNGGYHTLLPCVDMYGCLARLQAGDLGSSDVHALTHLSMA